MLLLFVCLLVCFEKPKLAHLKSKALYHSIPKKVSFQMIQVMSELKQY